MNNAYEVIIGLEVHAQLLTKSKMFCSCSTEFGLTPNSNICPVCTGQPGALPVLNSGAVDHAIRTALALNCKINETSVFARKNYFYPDLPKGYQISQHEEPLAVKGYIELYDKQGVPKKIGITRVHMEEDAGKNIHSDKCSFVDLNRSGVPLVEIVSEPDMRSPQEAVSYFKKLRAILDCIGVCACNMEEGNLRCDANVSLRKFGADKFGTKVEIKNLNSFRFLEKALSYEVERQTQMLDSGEKIEQETRLFDAVSGITKSMRKKEEANDYRYFPEPDLTPLVIKKDKIKSTEQNMPELPDAKKKRLMSSYGLNEYDADVLSSDVLLASYYEKLVSIVKEPKLCSNWVQTDIMRVLNEQKISIQAFKIKVENMAELLLLVNKGSINQNTAKSVFSEMLSGGRSAKDIVSEKGLLQIQDQSQIEAIVDEVIASNTAQVEQYKQGKTNIAGYLVGLVMKQSKGKANPVIVNEILKKKLS